MHSKNQFRNSGPDGGDMKTKTVVLILALCFVTGPVCFASDVQTGTWSLIKSEYQGPLGAHVALGKDGQRQLVVGGALVPVPKEDKVVYEAVGDNVKVTVDGTDSDGKPTHYEWTGKFDGKDYPVIGDRNSDTRSYEKVNDRTFELTIKKGGEVTPTGRVVVSFHGKTCTVTTSGTDPKGNFKNTAEYYRICCN